VEAPLTSAHGDERIAIPVISMGAFWCDKVMGVDHKPGSVLGNHSSVMLVAKHL